MPGSFRVFNFTVNNIGNREAIQVSADCACFEIIEDPGNANWPTEDYKISDVATGGTSVQRKGGVPLTFDRKGNGQRYGPNETFGYIETLTQSLTWQRIEWLN